MLRLLMLALALVTFSPGAWAQSNPTLTGAERGIRRDDEPAVHLRIEVLDVRAHLVGRTADVTVEMLIASDDADAYEAKLALTLPADAVVTGYALDVDGRMIPGQLLEAPKARNVYEDEVRAGSIPDWPRSRVTGSRRASSRSTLLTLAASASTSLRRSIQQSGSSCRSPVTPRSRR